MGRPPKPTALKVLSGTAAHNPQRINREEPRPALGAAPPPFLPSSGPARQAWNRHVRVLGPLRVLTVADADALALACMALAEYLDAREDEGGWRRADAAWKRYGAALGWFGLNPSARVRVHALPAEKGDPLGAWLAGGKS